MGEVLGREGVFGLTGGVGLMWVEGRARAARKAAAGRLRAAHVRTEESRAARPASCRGAGACARGAARPADPAARCRAADRHPSALDPNKKKKNCKREVQSGKVERRAKCPILRQNLNLNLVDETLEANENSACMRPLHIKAQVCRNVAFDVEWTTTTKSTFKNKI